MTNDLQRRRTLFWVDVLLIPVAVATAVTGIGFHRAGHFESHEVWECWALAHVVSSVLWIGLGVYHIYRHWGWYRAFFRRTVARRSCTTLLLTVGFLLIVVTGIVLLAFINGANSPVGMWHYRIGLVLIFLSLSHIVMRWKVLRKLSPRHVHASNCNDKIQGGLKPDGDK